MPTLITTLHASCDSRRAVEYKACLDINLGNSFFSSVKVILETDSDGKYGFLKGIEHNKLEIIQVNSRPFFTDLFAIANQCEHGEVVIVCNGDIYFDDCSQIERAIEASSNEFWTVSRYEELPDGKWQLYHEAPNGSHDCWIFRSPLNLSQSQYHPGVTGCDQILAQRAVEAGFDVINPCLSIKPRHLHRHDIRNNTLDTTFRCYWHDLDFLQLGLKNYCAPPCTLESRVIRSRRSLRYQMMRVVGRYFLPLYRSNFIKSQLKSLKA